MKTRKKLARVGRPPVGRPPVGRPPVGRPPVPGSSRLGAARITCFVSPADRERFRTACLERRMTSGELLVACLESFLAAEESENLLLRSDL